MAMTEYTASVEVITNIGTTPEERALTTDQFKAKFDEGLKGFVEWFNTTHKTEFEALATYEEGVWTPVLSFGGSTDGITYQDQKGRYTRIGNIVFWDISILLTNKGTATGSAIISGLPYPSRNETPYMCDLSSFFNITLPEDTTGMAFFHPLNSTTIELRRLGNALAVTVPYNNTHFNNNTAIRASGRYLV
jgi:hypothetical protein